MKYSLYNKERFLKNDEVVIDQEGNFLVLADGDAPNYINNTLDIDVLRHTNRKDKNEKTIIQGDIIISEYGISIVDYYNDSFIIVDITQQQDGSIFHHHHHFGNLFNWIKDNVEVVGNIVESNIKKFYRSVIDKSWRGDK
jgi:hypothetical protein